MRLTSGRWTRGHYVLRGLVLAFPQVAIWLTRVSGTSPDPKLVLLVLGLSVYAALAPESAASVVLLGVVVAWWGLAFRDLAHPEMVLAALCVLATHVCLTIAAYGPASLPVDRALVLLWVRRGLLVLVPVPLLYVGAVLLQGQPAPPGMWVIGMVCVLGAAVGATLLYPQGAE
jgi:hypothetical protein